MDVERTEKDNSTIIGLIKSILPGVTDPDGIDVYERESADFLLVGWADRRLRNYSASAWHVPKAASCRDHQAAIDSFPLRAGGTSAQRIQRLRASFPI